MLRDRDIRARRPSYRKWGQAQTKTRDPWKYGGEKQLSAVEAHGPVLDELSSPSSRTSKRSRQCETGPLRRRDIKALHRYDSGRVVVQVCSTREHPIDPTSS